MSDEPTEPEPSAGEESVRDSFESFPSTSTFTGSSSQSDSDSDSDPIHTLLAHAERQPMGKASMSVDSILLPSLNSADHHHHRSLAGRRMTGSMITTRAPLLFDSASTSALTLRASASALTFRSSTTTTTTSSSMTRSTSFDVLGSTSAASSSSMQQTPPRSPTDRNRGSVPVFVVQGIAVLQRHRDTIDLFSGSDLDVELSDVASPDDLVAYVGMRPLSTMNPKQVAAVVLRYLSLLNGLFTDHEARDLFLAYELGLGSSLSLLLLRSLLGNLSKTVLSLLSLLVGLFRSFLTDSPDSLPSVTSVRSEPTDLYAKLGAEQRERLSILGFRFGAVFRLPPDDAYQAGFLLYLSACYSFVRSNFAGDADIRFKSYAKNMFVLAVSEELLVWTLFDYLYWDKDYLMMVLMLHRYFHSRSELLRRIIDAYSQLAQFCDAADHPFLDRLSLVFRTWTRYLPADLAATDAEFCSLLQHFATVRPEVADLVAQLTSACCSGGAAAATTTGSTTARQLIHGAGSLNDMRDRHAKIKIPKKVKIGSSSVALDCKVKSLAGNATSPLHDHKATIIAASLTMIDNRLYGALSADEFLGKSFLKGASCAPNFLAMQQSFNRWSNWTCFEIVSRPKLDDRVQALTKLIYVAYICRLLNNFNTSYSIVAGLEGPPIIRLKQTWDKLSKKTLAIWSDLQKVFSIEDNHSNYRRALGTAHPPIVPYLGLYSKTFLTIEDNPNDPVKTRDGLINVAKLRNIYSLIKEIQQYQITAYHGLEPHTDILEYFENWKAYQEADLFSKSLECEPRSGTTTPRRLPRSTSGPMSASARILPNSS